MWLASMSLSKPNGEIVGAKLWCNDGVIHDGKLRKPIEVLHEVLDGVGQPDRERLFRMNITLCLHRGATPEEVAGLPASWHEDASGMAGGPVEVLWERGVKALGSAMPCESPGRKVVVPGRLDLWVPDDCGRCVSCLARQAVMAGEGAVIASPPGDESPT